MIRFSFLVLIALFFGSTLAEKQNKTISETVTRQSNRCSTQHFHCKNNQCIDKTLVCNGRPDCRDGSDESSSICFYPSGSAYTTPTTTTTTLRYEYYPFENRESEEPKSSCKIGEFICSNGWCINESQVCDGFDDCEDGSDESTTLCRNQPTRPSNPRNPSNNPSTPIPPTTKATFGCRKGIEFRCLSGECIQNKFICNGINDCLDGSDESDVLCPKTNPTNGSTRRPIDTNPKPNNWGSKSLSPCLVPGQPKNGRWRIHKSLCPTGRDCDLPSGVSTLNPGSYLVYSCDTGYALNGTSDVLCGPGGRWIHEPECNEIKCVDLSSSEREAICVWNNLAVSCDVPAPIGTEAQLRCREGFVQEISYSSTYKKVTCLANGQWDLQPITCVKKPKKVKLLLEGDMIIDE